jgi:hypothetical protein
MVKVEDIGPDYDTPSPETLKSPSTYWHRPFNLIYIAYEAFSANRLHDVTHYYLCCLLNS